MSRDILICAVDRWTAIWGDPVLSGMAFMLAYGVAGLLALRVGRDRAASDRGFWRLCGWIMLFQVANTHLDLHAFPGSLGRCMAHAQGWYAQRATVQIAAAILVAVTLALLLLWVVVRYRAAMWSNALLSTGMILSLGFTLLRGTSLHRLDAIYGRQLGGVPLSDVIEMTGVALVVLTALIRIRFTQNHAV